MMGRRKEPGEGGPLEAERGVDGGWGGAKQMPHVGLEPWSPSPAASWGPGPGPGPEVSPRSSGFSRATSSLRDAILSAFMPIKRSRFHYYPEMSPFQLPTISTQGITKQIPEFQKETSPCGFPLRIIPVSAFNPGTDPFLISSKVNIQEEE